MASALAQSFDKLNEIPTSSGNNVESKRKIQREIMDDCELTWEHIQEVMPLNLIILYTSKSSYNIH